MPYTSTRGMILFLGLAMTATSLQAQSERAFEGYVEYRGNLGMGGSAVRDLQQGQSETSGADAGQTPGPAPGTAPVQGGMPMLSDGREMNPERIEGFNEAIQQTFPMTPEMVRRYREIFEEQQRAILSRPQPSAKVDAGFVALEPGETPGRLTLSPGIASVIGFYDATGQAWPIDQYVVGSGENFEVIALGEDSNSLVLTPLTRVGWSNLVVRLRDEPKPVVLHIDISDDAAHFRHDIQVARMGPNAELSMASARSERSIAEAGSSVLLSVLTRTDIPRGAVRAEVANVQAEAWLIDDKMYVRSRHAMLSPTWTASLSGPDQIRVYEIPPSSMLLFSVNGRVTRATADLP